MNREMDKLTTKEQIEVNLEMVRLAMQLVETGAVKSFSDAYDLIKKRVVNE